jgi:hypothetical protein
MICQALGSEWQAPQRQQADCARSPLLPDPILPTGQHAGAHSYRVKAGHTGRRPAPHPPLAGPEAVCRLVRPRSTGRRPPQTRALWWVGFGSFGVGEYGVSGNHKRTRSQPQTHYRTHVYAHPPALPSPAVLLLQALEQWRAAHGGAVPASSADRAAFKKQVAAMRRSGPEGVPLDVSGGWAAACGVILFA